jgi:hypothetical protein
MNFHNIKYKTSPSALCGITLLIFKNYKRTKRGHAAGGAVVEALRYTP